MKVRNLFSVLLALCLIMPNGACGFSDNAEPTIEENKHYDYLNSEDIEIINSGDILEDSNFSQMRDFLADGGMVVVKLDQSLEFSLSEALDMSIAVGPISDADMEKYGVDLATIYYKGPDGTDGIYIINAPENAGIDKDKLIDDAIEEIKLRNTQLMAAGTANSVTASECSAMKLGTFDFTAASPPYGQVHARYDLYTIQDYNAEDFYIAKATIQSYPGEYLSKSDSNYEWQYVGNRLNVGITSPTSSVAVIAAEPQSTINAKTFSVNLNESMNIPPLDLNKIEIQTGISLGWSWTTEEIDVAELGSMTNREWDITIDEQVDGRPVTFMPGITYACPYTKQSMDMRLSFSYNLNSFWVFNKQIEFSRLVTCTSKSAVLQ